jgi:pimeloyl-ACP methyl ester carboxylesterase
VGRLRNGTYVATRTPSFQRVVVAGHSLGALVAQVEVSSFHDADALIVMSFSDTGSSPLATQTFAASGLTCATGGQRADGSSGPSGYAYFGDTPAQFRAAHFHDADPRVVQVATALRTRDPCGDYSSVPQALVTDQVALKTVTVPVLLVFGANDALFPPPAGERQKAMFSGSANVSLVSVPDTGHALALERSAPQFRAEVARWLQRL